MGETKICKSLIPAIQQNVLNANEEIASKFVQERYEEVEQLRRILKLAEDNFEELCKVPVDELASYLSSKKNLQGREVSFSTGKVILTRHILE